MGGGEVRMYVPFRRLAMGPQPRLTVKHRSARLVVGIRAEPLWEGRLRDARNGTFADAYLR